MMTWRPVVLVGGASLVLATEILVQEHIFEYELEETLLAFAEYFGEIALIGFAILSAVTLVDRHLPSPGRERSLALVGAVAGGLAAGVFAGLLLRYGAGPYPPFAYMLGEAMRWVGVAGALTFVHEVQRRDRAAVRSLHEIEVNRMALERRRTEARLQLMKAQIEPHFLFNTLATVKRLYRTEPRGGDAMFDRLMRYLHAALPRLREDEASLGDELDLIDAYLEILRIRMGERLRYSIRAAEALRGYAFPPMMLLTLVENAIKHGIGARPQGGRNDVSAAAGAGLLRIEVADTGEGFVASSGPGIGLSNIRARLAAIDPARASLSFAPNHPQGVVAAIEMPLPRPAR
jgi:signal transduction histidine kinase